MKYRIINTGNSDFPYRVQYKGKYAWWWTDSTWFDSIDKAEEWIALMYDRFSKKKSEGQVVKNIDPEDLTAIVLRHLPKKD